MAKPQVGYLASDDPSAVDANRAYQEALQRLNESLDRRKGRIFDPMWLAAARGFAAPTRSGSFFESLGSVAEQLGSTQEKLEQENIEEAQKRLEVASAGIGLERMKQRERLLRGYLGMGAEGGLPSGAPGAPPSAPSAVSAPSAPSAPSALPSAPPGALPGAPQGGLGKGIQIAPGNPSLMQADAAARMALLDPSANPQDVIKNHQEMSLKRYETKENGILDKGTGMFYPFPKGDLVEREIEGATYNVPAETAFLLDFYRANNDPRYWEIADRAIKGPDRPGGAAGTPLRSQTEKELEIEARRARQKKLSEESAKREAEVAVNDQNARRIYGITERVGTALNRSGDYFGIFQRPGIVNAIGSLVSGGVSIPGGTINLPALEDAVRKAMTGVRDQQIIDDIQVAAADLAELELIYTRIYLSGQGQVTEGERKVVRGILAGPQNSPQTVRSRMLLLRERSQHDMDVAEAWRRYSNNNPNKTLIEFEKTNEYSNLIKQYEQKMAALEKRLPAIPAQQRPVQGRPQTGQPGSLDAARERLRRELGQ